MHHLKAIIFDVDGTLANTEETHRQAFNSAFAEFGLNYYWAEAEYARLLSISGGRERITDYLKNHDHAISGDISLRDFAHKIHQRKSEIYREKLAAGHIGLRSGVARLIHEARATGIKLGIATATSRANVEILLQNTLGAEACHLFDSIVTSDMVKDKKPSPVVYQCALAGLGLTPGVCVAIEDTSNGNRAALAAGVKTVITTHAFTTDNNFNGASLVVDQLGEPDQPFKIRSGQGGGASYVDINLLRRITEAHLPDESYDSWQDSAVIAK